MSDTLTLLSAARRKWDAGDLSQAERLWQSVLAKDPAHAQAARFLGELYLDARQHKRAFDVVSVAARARPFDADLRLLMGRCLHALGNLPQARKIFDSILSRDPTSVAGIVGLALCAAAGRRAGEAVAMLRPLLPTHARNPYVQAALAQSYFTLGQAEAAIAHYREAIRLRPALAWRAELAWSYYINKQADEAIAEFDAVLAIEPRLEIAVSGKTQALIEQRREDEARQVLSEALSRGSLDHSMLLALWRLARSPEQRSESRRYIERHLTLVQGSSSHVPLYHALGRLKEAEGDFDGAFASFKEANDRSGPVIPAQTIAQRFDTLIRVFSKVNLDRLPRSQNRDPLPVFIVGMPRSGTSLVEQILASHPSICGAGELMDLDLVAREAAKFMSPPRGINYPGAILSMTATDAERMGNEYLKRLRAKSGGARVATDKMPSNFAHCGLIDLTLPGARIIHCVRNPLDTCVSIYATALSEAHAYKNDLRNLAAMYQEYHRLMNHWRSVIRVPMLDVWYEEVVADPEASARRLVEFVGLPWDHRCLKFYENQRAVGTASADQVRRPIYDTSIGRWKNYEQHLGPLIDGLRGIE